MGYLKIGTAKIDLGLNDIITDGATVTFGNGSSEIVAYSVAGRVRPSAIEAGQLGTNEIAYDIIGDNLVFKDDVDNPFTINVTPSA